MNTAPDSACDLIMKGGITSGVVYPRLVSGLAAKYRFQNIGGASAGAIAAAACAAAEFRRRQGDAGGFDTLARLPDELGTPLEGGGAMLRHLFQPSPALARHFDVLLAALNRPDKLAVAVNAVGTMFLRSWFVAVLVLLAMGGVVMALVRSTGPVSWGLAAAVAAGGSAVWLLAGWGGLWRLAREGAHRALAWLLPAWWLGGVALVFTLLLWLHRGADPLPWAAAALAAFAWGLALPLAVGLVFAVCGGLFGLSMLAGLRDNFWGFCAGRTVKGPEGLTDWLTRYLDELAGLPGSGRPLVLGDLWLGHRMGDDAPADIAPGERAINLEVMTTAVTLQMPYAIPFRQGAGPFHYDPEEWARLFPPRVMDWLLAASPTSDSQGRPLVHADGRPLRRLPPNRDLPVVLLVRLSLSFPVLLSAVPVYVVDRSSETQALAPKKVWFSDGGIGSNMPLHFFDAPLPRHPTFAVNLADAHPDYPIDPSLPACDPGNHRIHLPGNQGGLQRYWAPPDESRFGLFALLWSIVRTMQTWRDEMQLQMPGYRDRVVRVAQLPHEGGLNLDMPRTVIHDLAEAGACAAERLVERFWSAPGEAEAAGWASHRATRLGTFMALAEALGRHPAVHDAHWPDEVRRRYGGTQEALALRVLAAVKTFGPPSDRDEDLVLDDGAPRPRPELRVMPKV